ncbi:energy-coupling factor transporter transmembrane component T [Lactiplantibacillus daowaiensis]|uniref:Energy-coupling factor transporter transmembrane component T n=1 Tax=Lactiplantibacillus daowaiensis TaxID=2559918 RepID=A0ABW1RZ66_9LACO|nr:energy-coupling factor transporter transmembrane component T [Lactiplantibacillus daowaiensis]
MIPNLKTKPLPTWLTVPNHPVKSKRRASMQFLSRNQHHLRHLLQRLAQPAPVQPSSWPLSPQINLLRLGLVLLLIASVHSFVWLWGLALLLGLQLLLLPPRQLRYFIRRWLLSCCIAVIIVLPSYWLAGPATVVFFGVKTSLMLANAQYFRLTTTFQDVLAGLKAWHCPNVLIMTLAIAMIYLRMLGQHLLLTTEALDLRLVAPTRHPYRLIGALFGNLYLKSYAYALELYAAMEARGFNGHYAKPVGTASHWRDYLSLSPVLILMGLLLFGGH